MSTYKFRFEFVDNIRSVAGSVKAQFAGMKAAAKSFADQVNANRGLAGFKNMAKVSSEFFNSDRVRGFAQAFVQMNDDLAISEGLILSITGSRGGLDAARQSAKDLRNSIGISVIDATKGLAQMLPLAKGNIEQASKLAVLAAGLGALNKEEGFQGAAFALKELESGDALSLRERFNIRVPDKKEAEAIAKRDGKTVQEVLFDSLQNHLDNTYGQGKKGQGVKTLLAIDQNTISGQIKQIMASMTSAFTPIIASVGPKITAFFTGVSKWMNDNKEAVEKLIPPLFTLVGVFAGFAGVSSIVSGVTTAISGAKAAIAGLPMVLGILTSPITLVVVGIAGLTAGIIYLWNRFEGFRGAVMGYIAVLREIGAIIYEFVNPAFARFRKFITDLWPALKWIAKGIYDWLIAPFKIVAKIVGSVFEFIKGKIKSSVKGTNLEGTMQRLGNAAREGYQKGVDAKPITLFGKKKGDKALAASSSPYAQLAANGGASAAGSGGKAGAGSSVGAVSGEGVSGSAKDIRITINKLVETMNVSAANLPDMANKIRQEVTRALVDAVNDFNYAN